MLMLPVKIQIRNLGAVNCLKKLNTSEKIFRIITIVTSAHVVNKMET